MEIEKWWEGRKLIRSREKTYGVLGFLVYLVIVAIIIYRNWP